MTVLVLTTAVVGSPAEALPASVTGPVASPTSREPPTHARLIDESGVDTGCRISVRGAVRTPARGPQLVGHFKLTCPDTWWREYGRTSIAAIQPDRTLAYLGPIGNGSSTLPPGPVEQSGTKIRAACEPYQAWVQTPGSTYTFVVSFTIRVIQRYGVRRTEARVETRLAATC